MDSSSHNNTKKSNSNKIREIVRLQQILKKWKKLANAPKSSGTITAHPPAANSSATAKKSIKFLKKTLSFSESSSSSSSASGIDVIPKGYLAVCVGQELKRFVIPTEYLGHQAFGVLLREAEEEFGFHQEGVLKIPCEVTVFEKILKMMERKREVFFLHDLGFGLGGDQQKDILGCFSPDNSDDLTASHQPPQLCR